MDVSVPGKITVRIDGEQKHQQAEQGGKNGLHAESRVELDE
jgi:hypothetical protein